MSAAGSSLLLWQIPELEDRPRHLPSSATMTADEIPEIWEATAPAYPAPDHSPGTDAIEDHQARGYAEGWERGVSEGRERGYAEGIAAGTEAAQTAGLEQVDRLAAIAAKLTAPIEALDAAVEEAVVALALEIARCVIGSETSRSRDYLVRLIREAVAKVPIEMGAVRIVLNPADRELIKALAPEIADGNTLLVGDEGVEPGDCIVVADGRGGSSKDMRWRPRAGESQIDLSLATRWRAVIRALFEGEDR